MKYCTATSAALALALPVVAQEKSSAQLKDLKDKVSYSIGIDIGMNFKKQGMDLNPDTLAAGARDALSGKPQLTPNDIREVMTAWQKEVGEKQKIMATKNQAD